MKSKIALILISLFLLLTSCSSDDAVGDSNQSNSFNITGKWRVEQIYQNGNAVSTGDCDKATTLNLLTSNSFTYEQFTPTLSNGCNLEPIVMNNKNYTYSEGSSTISFNYTNSSGNPIVLNGQISDKTQNSFIIRIDFLDHSNTSRKVKYTRVSQ